MQDTIKKFKSKFFLKYLSPYHDFGLKTYRKTTNKH